MTNGNDPAFAQDDCGLTKREYFAALAMQGFLSIANHATIKGVQAIPGAAVEFADLLIKKLNEPVKSPEDVNLKN